MIHEVVDKKPKQKRREAKEKNILDMSMKLILENGLAGFSINRLAAELDYTPGALYRYYPSRDAIIAELEAMVIWDFQRYFRETFPEAEKLSIEPEDEPVLKLILLSELYLAVSILEPAKYYLITAIIADSRVLVNDHEAEKVRDALLPLLSDVSRLFSQVQVYGLFNSGNSFERSIIYLSVIQGVLQLKKIKRLAGSLFELNSIYFSAIETLFSGWGIEKSRFARLFLLSQKVDLPEIIKRIGER